MPDHRFPISRLALATTVVVLAGYLITFVAIPQTGFWSGDSGCKFIQLEGILESGYRDYSVSWPGRNLDPELAFLPIREPFGRVIDGKLFLQYSPVFATVSSVFYRLFGFSGLFLLPFAAGLLTLPAVWKLAESTSDLRIAPPAAVLLAAFGTPLWFYSSTWWEMTLGVGFVMWAARFGIEYVRGRRLRSLAVAAGLSAAAIYFRDEMYVFAAAVGVASILYGRRSWSHAAAFAATLIAVLAPLWIFQWQAVGAPFGHHFGELGSGAARFLPDRATVFENLLVATHEVRWISVVTSALPVVLLFTMPRLGARSLSLGVPVLAVIGTLVGLWLFAGHRGAENPVIWLMSANGMFAVTPFVLLAFARPVDPEEEASTRRRALWLVLVLYVLGYVVAAPVPNSEGIHWGCRFLLAAYPLLAVLAAGTLAAWWSRAAERRRLGSVAVVAVLLLSVVFQLHSLRLLHHRQTLSERLNHAVAVRPEPVVVATGWPVPQELYRVFHRKPIFLLREPSQSERLLHQLRDAGHDAAVYVAWPPRPGSGAGRRIIDDPLSFPSFEVSPVSLAR